MLQNWEETKWKSYQTMKKFVSVQNSSTKIPGNIPKTDKNVQKGVENQNYQQKFFDQNIYHCHF